MKKRRRTKHLGERARILFLEANKLLENSGQQLCLRIKGWFDELFDGYLIEMVPVPGVLGF
jgi:hypothetical protein